MGYTKTIVCLANSVKYRGACVAGREVLAGGFGGWVRPISGRPAGELTPAEMRYEGRGLPRLLDVMEVPLLGPSPHHHQTENHLIDPQRLWRKRGELSWGRVRELAESPETLWSNAEHTATGQANCVAAAAAVSADRSLYLIQCSELRIARLRKPGGGPAYRGTFAMNGRSYTLAVTDPVATLPIAYLRDDEEATITVKEPCLCVSLAEPFSGDGRCHKLISAVIAKPEA